MVFKAEITRSPLWRGAASGKGTTLRTLRRNPPIILFSDLLICRAGRHSIGQVRGLLEISDWDASFDAGLAGPFSAS
jgi:hypothetical protein